MRKGLPFVGGRSFAVPDWGFSLDEGLSSLSVSPYGEASAEFPPGEEYTEPGDDTIVRGSKEKVVVGSPVLSRYGALGSDWWDNR